MDNDPYKRILWPLIAHLKFLDPRFVFQFTVFAFLAIHLKKVL